MPNIILPRMLLKSHLIYSDTYCRCLKGQGAQRVHQTDLLHVLFACELLSNARMTIRILDQCYLVIYVSFIFVAQRFFV